MIDKDTVKKNFSRHARHYDGYSDIQRLCGSRLISKVDSVAVSDILDIGCGTGSYTKLLRERFPSARIRAVDLSPAMIDVAREKLRGASVELAVADGEKIGGGEMYDLVSSNASFQWFEDPEKALAMYKGMLKPGGMILFSVFGPLTFEELDDSIKELSGGGISIVSSAFFGKKRVEEVMERLFVDIEIEEAVYRQKYGSLPELLQKIKYTGARGNGAPGKNLWTPGAMSDLERIYRKAYKDIVATYQVFFCKGIRR